MRVLVVDDEQVMADLIVEVLTDEGFDAHAVDGPEAINAAEEYSPDLILLDWMMRPVPGESVLGALRENSTLSSIPVILVSAFHDADTVAQRWCVPVLRKPFDVRRLLSTIEGIVGSQHGHSDGRVPGIPG